MGRSPNMTTLIRGDVVGNDSCHSATLESHEGLNSECDSAYQSTTVIASDITRVTVDDSDQSTGARVPKSDNTSLFRNPYTT